VKSSKSVVSNDELQEVVLLGEETLDADATDSGADDAHQTNGVTDIEV
jgi:hypothetical protein